MKIPLPLCNDGIDIFTRWAIAQRLNALLHILNNVKGGFACIIIHLEKIILEDLVVGEVIMILKQRHLGQLISAPLPQDKCQ